MADQIFLCNSKNGKLVTYDPVDSHAATHLEDTPHLKDLVIEAISTLILNGDVGTEIDMGRAVGTSDVVDTDFSDNIVYGVRKNRDEEGHVPFVKSRHGEPSPYVALHLVKQNDDSYVLSSTWIGTFSGDDEPCPNAPGATERRTEIWNRRAFISGSQEIQVGTETTERPW